MFARSIDAQVQGHTARKVMAIVCAAALVLAMCFVVPPSALAAKAPAKPAKANISSIKSSAAGQMQVKVAAAKNAKGYQYLLGTNKKVTAGKKSYNTSSRSITYKGLKQGQKYFVKVRAFNKAGGKTVWGPWSAVKSTTVKKAASTPAKTVTTTKTVSGVSVDSAYTRFSEGSAVELKEGIKVDFSNAKYGYIGVKGTRGNGTYAGHRLKVQIKKAGTYTYDLATNGTIGYYPLNMGDGTYTVQVLRNTSGNSYTDRGSKSFSVSMINAYQPFMHNNAYVDYSSGSNCVKQGASICSGKKTDTERAAAIINWVTKNISYDHALAKNVAAGYVPDPDKTLRTRKGICFEYASLTAAMMRSQGVPCKVITGYVHKNGSKEDMYHAWNLIYLKNQGWVAKEVKAQTDKWGHVDVTFNNVSGSNSLYKYGATKFTY